LEIIEEKYKIQSYAKEYKKMKEFNKLRSPAAKKKVKKEPNYMINSNNSTMSMSTNYLPLGSVNKGPYQIPSASKILRNP
jgi:hypothetical protein